MIPQRHKTIAFTVLFGCLASFLTAQAPKKQDPWVKDKLKEYGKLIKDRKGAKDAAAIELIDEMLKKYEAMHPKDQKAFAKGISDCLLQTWCKREPSQAGIYRTTIKALSLTGENGAPFLAKAFEKKEKFKDKEWDSLRGDMLEKLGSTKDEKYVDFLLDVALKYPNDSLMAKAGGALRHYKDLKLAQRKDIAKLLIKKFTNIYDNANKNLDPGDLQVAAWRARLAAVSDPWNTALQALTRQQHRAANEWNRFLNKHGGDDWDKPLKTTR